MSHDLEPSVLKLHQELGLKRLNLLWAKAEVLIGLAAAEISIFAPDDLIANWIFRASLFVLGFYFAMAGHRSHLYQSSNRLIAHVVSKMER